MISDGKRIRSVSITEIIEVWFAEYGHRLGAGPYGVGDSVQSENRGQRLVDVAF